MNASCKSSSILMEHGQKIDLSVDRVFKVITGSVAQCVDGREKQPFITQFIMPSSLLIASKHTKLSQFAIALGNCRLEKIDPHLNIDTYHKQLEENYSYDQAHKFAIARMNASKRVKWFLETLSVKYGTRHVLLPMTRQNIADHLGLTIETVSRNLSSMKSAGIVTFQDAKSITIIN